MKALYFNANRTDHIVGFTRKNSDELLDKIHNHITQNKYRYDHKWKNGDIIIWDNRCLVHSVNVDYPVGEERVHLRTILKGNEELKL
jgi:taurine dioxygenase